MQESLPPAAGDRIDRYRLLQQIGSGGMGEVWLAEQTEPIRRRVAFKLVKSGLDGSRLVARFAAERQALARMDHPAIAKVLDAGSTAGGRPYFVMEYVPGQPITEFCDQQRLDARQRLELFTKVCEGVQHAHHKSVIHRDLKPNNVLVSEIDGVATPKIIDFGIAKAMDDLDPRDATLTGFGQLVGTPAYMSPEQARLTNDAIDTRTDVYALGMILYELLVGALPFDPEELESSGFEGLRRILLETDALRPSARLTHLGERAEPVAARRGSAARKLAMQLRGDLDWIILKALEKQPSRRYATPQEFAADIERHLRDEPVLAGPPSARYRLGKFVRRNRAGVIGAAAVLLVLLIGVVASTVGFVRAVRAERLASVEAENAKQQAAIAQAVNRFLNDDLLAAVAPSARKGRGRDVLMREVLDVASERIEAAGGEGGSLVDQPLVEAEIRKTLGLTYRGLGEYDAAEGHFERAIELRRRTPADVGPLAAAIGDLGLLAIWQGRYAAAESLFTESMALRLAQTEVDTVTFIIPTAFNLATIYQRTARVAPADSLYVWMLGVLRRRVGDEHDRTLIVMNNLANLRQELGRLEEAEELQARVFEVRRKIDGEEDPSTLSSMNNLANIYWSQGKLQQADSLLVRALELKRKVLGPEHPSTLNSFSGVASMQSTFGDQVAAERLGREVLEIRERVLGAEHPITQTSRNDLAFFLVRQGRYAEALEIAGPTAEYCSSELGDAHDTTLSAMLLVALCEMGMGRLDDAARDLQRVHELGLASDAVVPALPVRAQAYLGLLSARRGQGDAARGALDESLPRLEPWESETRSILEAAIELFASGGAADATRLVAARELLERADGYLPVRPKARS